MKRKIRLTETDLKNIIRKSVTRILKEARGGYNNSDDMSNIMQQLKNAYDAIEELEYTEFKPESLQRAEENDNINLHNEWFEMRNCLENAMEHARKLSYYVDSQPYEEPEGEGLFKGL